MARSSRSATGPRGWRSSRPKARPARLLRSGKNRRRTENVGESSQGRGWTETVGRWKEQRAELSLFRGVRGVRLPAGVHPELPRPALLVPWGRRDLLYGAGDQVVLPFVLLPRSPASFGYSYLARLAAFLLDRDHKKQCVVEFVISTRKTEDPIM